jgi:hypothetical protein
MMRTDNRPMRAEIGQPFAIERVVIDDQQALR